MTHSMLRHRLIRAALALVALFMVVMLASCGDTGETSPSRPERASAGVDPSSNPRSDESAESLPEAVDAENAVLPLRLAVGSRSGYLNAEGILVLDVLEGDAVDAMLLIKDAEGRPVRGVRPTITPTRDSRVLFMDGEDTVSNDSGEYPFGLMGGTMGEEPVEIALGEAGGSVLLNVISQRAAGYGWLDEIEGALDWDLLFQADIQWKDEGLTAIFPDEVLAMNGQTVKLAGFMMPLETAQKQKHFVVTSSPPGCYFHLPGGPAGAVEVFATKALEPSWDPFVLEGRFEALEASEMGVVYRLHDARAIEVPPRS